LHAEPRPEEVRHAPACSLSVLSASLLALCSGAASSQVAGPGPDQAIGQRFEVKADALPKPGEGPIVRNPPLIADRDGRTPAVPDGWEVTLFADKLPGPRQALVLPNGDLAVVSQGTGSIFILRDADGDGRAEWIQRHSGGFDRPNGIAHRPGELLVADQQGIWRLGYQDGAVRSSGTPARRAADVPPAERRPDPVMDGQKLLTERGVFGLVQGHANRDLEIGPDGRPLCRRRLRRQFGRRAGAQGHDPELLRDGKDQKTVASGTRNPVGLAFHPETGELWASVQERDGFGDRLVPDFLIRVQPGGFYGWPYAYTGKNPQPGFAAMAPDKVAATIAPDLLFEGHSAAMDFVFLTGERVPAEFRGDAIVALKGSWNRSQPTGYKVVRVKFEGGRPVGWYDNFMTGFWTEGTDKALVWGRPADVALGKDGSLFVVDDTGGTIWRVTPKADREATGSTRPRQ
jgi:glucose/arabinose dehydrogenase